MGASRPAQPGLESWPGRCVHADFVASAAFAVADEQRAASSSRSASPARRAFVDAQPRAIGYHDQARSRCPCGCFRPRGQITATISLREAGPPGQAFVAVVVVRMKPASWLCERCWRAKPPRRSGHSLSSGSWSGDRSMRPSPKPVPSSPRFLAVHQPVAAEVVASRGRAVTRAGGWSGRAGARRRRRRPATSWAAGGDDVAGADRLQTMTPGRWWMLPCG